MKEQDDDETQCLSTRRRTRLASLGVMHVLRLVVLGPFKLAAAVWEIGVRTSFGLVNGPFYGFMGFMGD